MHLSGLARTLASLLLAALVGCGTTSSSPGRQITATPAPAGFPADFHERAAARGEPVYRIDPGASVVTLTVRRAGSLARLGHDHVVASRSVQGYVSAREGRADLYVPLSELSVDEPALRAQAGLDTQPTAADIEGTRSNMQDKVLRVQEFPYALVQVRGVDAQALAAGRAQATVSVTLLGRSRSSTVPLELVSTAQRLGARGTLELKQTDFGIAPFSILGGAVQVKDEVEVRFDIQALRPDPGAHLSMKP